MADPSELAAGLSAYDPHQPTMQAYNPTWRDQLARMLMGDGQASPERRNFVQGLTGSTGLGTTGMSLSDMTPLGNVFGAQESARQGDYRGAAMNAMFLGPGARTADHLALAAAQKMAAAGAERDAIHSATGWFQGADSKWRFEIPDNGLRLDSAGRVPLGANSPDQSGYLSSLMKHPTLYDAYPELRDVTAYPRMAPGAPSGQYLEGGGQRFITATAPTQEDLRSTLLHEAQHAIQGIEGFSPGGNTGQLTMDGYRRTAGEVEARNTELRRNWSAADRRAAPPWQTEDVPANQQIVR